MHAKKSFITALRKEQLEKRAHYDDVCSNPTVAVCHTDSNNPIQNITEHTHSKSGLPSELI